MVFLKIKQIKQGVFQNKISLLLSAVLTFTFALLISAFFFSLNSKPYSISHILKPSIILFCGLFGVMWWIVNRKKQHLTKIFNSLFLTSKRILATRIFVLSFIVLSITAGLFSTFEFPHKNYLTKPTFKYLIEIKLDKANPGNICIIEIKNSNGAISIAQNPGSWKRDFNGCAHYLEAGTSGKILFENIGPIDEEIEIIARSDPKAGGLLITSEPGIIKTINLRSDEDQNLTYIFNLGTLLIKKITNWGLKAGYVSILLAFLSLMPISFYKENLKLLDNFSNNFSKSLRNQKYILNAWQRLDLKEAAIITIIIFYIAGVIFSVCISKPMAYGPSHFGDEVAYWDIALNLYKGAYASMDFFYIQPPFYPISLLPAFFLFYPYGTYTAAKILNALYITSAIIPAYLLLRKFINRNLSLVAITILLLNPVNIIMPSRILTENIFYPIFMWTVLFSFTNVLPASRKNRVIECLVLGILLGLNFFTRYIALALIPAFLLIWWLKPFENERLPLLFSTRKFLHLIIILIPLVLIMGGWIKFGLTEGLRVKDTLGLFIAESPNPDQLSFGRLIMWSVFYGSFATLIAAPYLPILLSSLSRFKLRDWQEDSNRWLIALAAIILFFLIACIRHSWRISYNYPIPIKLQGRYLLYFGPLFLITTFIALKKTFTSINRIKLIIYACAMILIAYAFLYIGILYLDGPLAISISSPDGDLIQFMGISFIALTLTNVIVSSLLINKRRIALCTFLVIFLFVFFTYGNVNILRKRLNSSSQIVNSEIYNLVQEFKNISSSGIDKHRPPSTIFIPNDSSSFRFRLLEHTLSFNGYPEVELIPSDNISGDKYSILLQAKDSNYSLSLKELTEEDYLISDKKKYSLFGKFYEYQLELNN